MERELPATMNDLGARGISDRLDSTRGQPHGSPVVLYPYRRVTPGGCSRDFDEIIGRTSPEKTPAASWKGMQRSARDRLHRHRRHSFSSPQSTRGPSSCPSCASNCAPSSATPGPCATPCAARRVMVDYTSRSNCGTAEDCRDSESRVVPEVCSMQAANQRLWRRRQRFHCGGSQHLA